jgi:hypothetical protein
LDTKRANQQIHTEQIVAALVTSWEATGHSLGVGEHLQLRQLLQHIPDDVAIPRLKNLLAPLFANNAQSQQDFNQLFDKVVALTQQQMERHEKEVATIKTQNAKKNIRRFVLQYVNEAWNFWFVQPLWLRAVALVLLLGGLTAMFYSQVLPRVGKSPLPVSAYLTHDLHQSSPQQSCFVVEPGKGQPTKIRKLSKSHEWGYLSAQLNGGLLCLQSTGLLPSQVAEWFELCYDDGNCEKIRFVLTIDFFNSASPSRVTAKHLQLQQPKRSGPVYTEYDKARAPLFVDDTASPLPKALDSIPVNLNWAKQQFDPSKKIEGVTSSVVFGGGFAYFTPLKGLIVVLTALLLAVLGWWAKRQRQQFTLAHKPNREKPYVWTIRIPHLGDVNLGRVFQQTLTEMRKRNAVNSMRLDIPLTIEASIQKGGAIDFQYARLTQSKQYLVLLDISSQNNHQAKVFDLLMKSLEKDEAPIVRFYFDGDPRLCWNEKQAKEISLQSLQHNYQDYYLIICSNGFQFLQAETNELTDWALMFNTWRRRVLLTPRLDSEWGMREEVLGKHFRLLPGHPQGILDVVSTLELVEHIDYRKAHKHQPVEEDALPVQIPSSLPPDQLLTLLKAEFTDHRPGEEQDHILQWIAACAIPPVLFWDWTLFTGKYLGSTENDILTLENLLRIARIPWFIEGKMPDTVRNTLLDWMERSHPDTLYRLRNEWNQILRLEENLPPLGSIAWEGHRVEIIMNKLLQNPKWYERRKLEIELERLIHGQQEQDAMVVRYLDNKKGTLEAVLSNRFRRFIQEKQGIVWHWRNWTWQLPILIMMLFSTLLVHYTEPVTIFQFEDYISELAFTPDSKSIVVANDQGSLAMCSVDGNWLQGKKAQGGKVVGLATSTDGKIILTGNTNNKITYWDILGTPVLHENNGGKRLVNAVAFHPADPYLALIGYFANQAELRDMRTGAVNAVFPHDGQVLSVAFSPDGRLALTGSQDSTAKLWLLESGKPLQVLSGHRAKINAVAFSPDGQQLLTGSRDNTAKLWSLDGKLLKTFDGHSYDVFSVNFSPDGSNILTTSGDHTAILWSIESGRPIRKFYGHRNHIKASAFSPDGNYLATGDQNGLVKLWHLKEASQGKPVSE